MSLKMTNNPFTNVLSWRIYVKAQNTSISNKKKETIINDVLQLKKEEKKFKKSLKQLLTVLYS